MDARAVETDEDAKVFRRPLRARRSAIEARTITTLAQERAEQCIARGVVDRLRVRGVGALGRLTRLANTTTLPGYEKCGVMY